MTVQSPFIDQSWRRAFSALPYREGALNGARSAIRVLAEPLAADLVKVLDLADRIDELLDERLLALTPHEIAEGLEEDVAKVRTKLNVWRDRRFRKLSDGRWGKAVQGVA